ncbi:MAG: hypothetical protein HY913_05875 [Desulfomonile tiedjei]|nr:hypothetical protein [Desulfomonile tiedjei]
MKVDFFTGVLKEGAQPGVRVWCAVTPFGIRALKEDRETIILDLAMERLSTPEPIVTVDLAGLDRNSAETIVDLILQSGLLGKPGVKHKGDAVLFMLTNEALHALAQVMREEEADADEEPPSST